jgi:hypothetical protein
VLVQEGDVALPAQEPEQLDGDRLEVDALRRDEREALGEIEADLTAEDTARAGPGAVGLVHAVVESVAQEVLVGVHHGDGSP